MRTLAGALVSGGAWPAVGGGLLLVAMGLGIFALGAFRGERSVRAAGLVLVLVGGFVAFTAVLWRLGGGSPLLSWGVFAGAIGMFRLMGSFEPPPRTPPPAGDRSTFKMDSR